MSGLGYVTRRIPSSVWRYGLAVVSVTAALVITRSLKDYTDITPLFYAAIVVSAWFGGMGPGLLAVLLSAIALDYYFVEPLYTLRLGVKHISFVVVFGLLAVLTSWMSSKRREAEGALKRNRDELEIRVLERTKDLRRAYDDLREEILERRHVEATVQERANLLDLTHDSVFVRDMHDVITFWNRGAEKQYGWTSAEAVGRISHEIIKTRFPAPLPEIISVLMRKGRWEGELVHTHRDGTEVTVASRWALQRDERGNPIAVLETNNDITERKRAAEALNKVQTELAHVTRVMTLGELTASIAHEVNQPLSAIVTNGNACLRWLDGQSPNLAESRLAVGRIIKDGYRASEVISRIRRLVKKAPPRKDRIDVNEMITEVIALTRNEVHRKHVSMKVQLSEDLPLVLGDRVQLQQVILNLIMNGLEAIVGQNGGLRELSVSSDKDQAGNVVVAVRDSGVGIDSETLDKLFDAFFTTKEDGMGMGLAISRSIVEANGGRLWATSTVPQGAIFQFTLPINV